MPPMYEYCMLCMRDMQYMGMGRQAEAFAWTRENALWKDKGENASLGLENALWRVPHHFVGLVSVDRSEGLLIVIQVVPLL